MSRCRSVCTARPPGLRQVVGDRLLVARGEPRGQVAPVDLARRPPQRVRGRLALAAATRGVVAQVARAAAGQQTPAQDRAERRALDVGARVGSDVGGGGVGLLGGEATELDREGDAVARGPDVIDADDASVGVDGDEAVGVGRYALRLARPRRRGSARMRPPSRRRPDGRMTMAVGGPGSRSAYAPSSMWTPACSSSSVTSSTARAPKIASGACSGVTSVISGFMPMPRASAAMSSASS